MNRSPKRRRHEYFGLHLFGGRSRTTLLTIAVAIAGAIAFTVLPVSPLPQVDFPTISVSASLPGASAQIMAASWLRRLSANSATSPASPR